MKCQCCCGCEKEADYIIEGAIVSGIFCMDCLDCEEGLP